MRENSSSPRGSFGAGRPRSDSKPPFKKTFDKGGSSFGKSGKSFDRGFKPFDKDRKPFGKPRGLDDERKISTYKACVIRLEKTAQNGQDAFALEETLQKLMEHFPLAVFGFAGGSEISLAFDLSSKEVYGNSADKLITVAASIAGVVFTKLAEDGKEHYFGCTLIQPFKDKLAAYFEERQKLIGAGICVYRSAEGLKVEDALDFTESQDFLLEKLKEATAEKKDDFKPRSFGDRPPRSFGDKPPRSFGDRPPRSFGDRPPRSFGDKPPRSFGDRPPRSFGDKPEKSFGDRKPREFNKEYGDRKPREFNKEYGDHKPREFNKEYGDHKPREFGKENRDYKPREYGDRKPRDFQPRDNDSKAPKDKIGYTKSEKTGYVSDATDPGAVKFRSFAGVDTTKSKGYLERKAKREKKESN